MAIYYQLVHTLSYGDAISTEVLALDQAFKELGHRSKIFAINVHPRHKGKALSYKELGSEQKPDLLILHYSIGSELNEVYGNFQGGRRYIIYHNVTPPEWFKRVNPFLVRRTAEGLKELEELIKLSDGVIADSNFNADEVRDFCDGVEVLPLPLSKLRWEAEANRGISNLLKDGGGINFLHVGRVAPNKCIEDIIKIFFFYHHYHNKDSRLWLVGIDADTELYSYSLKRLCLELSLEGRVNFTGCMDDTEVRALYEGCDFYICMSEHEGFCLPVLEAAYFGLPVLAYRAGAVPETLGSAGVLVESKDYAYLAALLHNILQDTPLLGALSRAGKERARLFTYERFFERVKELF